MPEKCPRCTDGSGWLHYQAPGKPCGVLSHSEPCPLCNPSGFRPTPPIIAELYKGQYDYVPSNVTEQPL